MFQRTKICSGLLLAFGGAAALAPAARAQDNNIQRVEITGSSIKRIDAETSLPMQTVSREQIDRLGVVNTEQLFQTITANSAVGGSFTAQGAGSSTYGLAAVSLRGMGMQRTLVLVNGRRLANYATDGTAVDINSIPLAIIERVEVLKDGASGVYGSDAVAGVVNFITRKNFKGVELGAYAGTPTQSGGGKSTKGSIVLGFGDMSTDHVNFTASLDIAKESAIYGRQRGYADHGWDDGGLYGYGATPSGTLYDGTTSSSSAIGHPLSPSNCAANGSKYLPMMDTCRFDSAPFVPLSPDVTRLNGSVTLRSRVNDDTEFFIEGFLSHNKTITTEQASPYSSSFMATDKLFAENGVVPAIVLNPTNPAYQSIVLPYLLSLDKIVDEKGNHSNYAGKPVAVSYRAVDGGLRQHTDYSDLYHLATGLEGSLSGFDYDATYSHNTSTVRETTQSGYQSQLAMVQLLSGNDAFNPYALNQTPALAAQINATNYAGPMISSSLTTDAIDAKASHAVGKLPGGEATVAVGLSFRKEHLSLNPSAAYMSGDISGYGGQVLPMDVSRNSRSIFAEIDAPLLKQLDVDLSVRNDHYPTASTTNPKLSMSFTPIQQAKLRASWGKGFRMASLPELYTPNAAATTNSFTDSGCVAFYKAQTPPGNTAQCKGQWNQMVGGNPDLVPEKSKQFSVGLVLEPVRSLSATVDYYNIKVKDLISALGAETIVNAEAEYPDLVARDPATHLLSMVTNINRNAGALDTSGVDLDVKWKSAKSSAGAFGLDLNGTWVLRYLRTLNQVDPDIPPEKQPSVGVTSDYDGHALTAVTTGGVIFRWRHALTASWEYGPYDVQLTQNFQSKYLDAPRDDCDDKATDFAATCHVPHKVRSFQTWDLQGAYTGIKNTTLRLGVRNVFDTKPPVAVTGGQYFQAGYDPSYYDPHGRFVYASGSYKF